MGGGFSLVGNSTGGLFGPASVVSHPNFNNLVGGGSFTGALPKKAPTTPGEAPAVASTGGMTSPSALAPQQSNGSKTLLGE